MNYEDILNLPHPVSKKHKPMEIGIRSAQFAPFAALTGYEEMVDEEARLTNDEKNITEEVKLILDCKFQILQDCVKEKPEIIFTYFVHDQKKKGGEYVTVKERVSKINFAEKKIYLMNGMQIKIGEIVNMESEIFHGL